MSVESSKSECSNSEIVANNTEHWNKQLASRITESLSEFYGIFTGELDRFILEVVKFVPADNPNLFTEALFVHRTCMEEKKESFIRPVEGMLDITTKNLATSMIDLTKKELGNVFRGCPAFSINYFTTFPVSFRVHAGE